MRRLVLGLVAALAVAALAYSAAWYSFARALERELPAWAEARRAQGYAIAWRAAEIGGFPLALQLHLSGVSFQAARPFPYRIEAETLALRTRPWRWTDWRFAAPEGGRIELPAGAAFAAEDITGDAAATGDGLAVTARSGALAGSGLADGVAAAALEAHLALPAHAPQGDRDPLASLEASLKDTRLPDAPPPLRELDAVDAAVTVRGAVPAGPLENALAQWRDEGGTLDLDRLRLARGQTAADLEGTLALDGALQPEGALTATLTGGDKFIDTLVASGALPKRFAGFAKSLLGAIASEGEPGTIRVPVTIQDQRLYIGPAEVAVLPHIDWR